MPFRIIRDDITKVRADAIVNTANPKPTYAPGADSAIYDAAGARKLLKEREKIGNIEVGQAAVTKAFALKAKYIIHTVGPAWIDGDHGEREAVRSCYENSLQKAKELKCPSIAFPLIATGIYGFPKADALQIAISVFSEFLSDTDMDIILVVFDEDSFVLSGKIFSGVDAYIDENYVSEKFDEEYGHPASYAAAMTCGSANVIREEESSFRRSLAAKESTVLMAPMQAMETAPKAAPKAAPQEKKKAKRSLDDVMDQVGETWQESLFRLIDEKEYSDVEVYKRANVDRKLFSKIKSNAAYQPKKITAIAFALALKLTLDETKDMLRRAGYALSPSSKFDLIIEYFIEQEVYDTYTINLALFDHKQPLLGE